MVDIKEVARNIYLIDNHLYSIPGLGSVYLINEAKKALIDTGPAASAGTVLDGIKKAGVRPEEIDYIIVTHIHIDHVGGAGVLLKDMPQAQVLAYHKGAKHLASPEILNRSVRTTMGEEVVATYGDVAPVDTQRLRPVYDGETIELGSDQILRIIEAPGHAPHELCIYESRNNGLFTGDTVGMYFAESGVLMPVTPPPGFDLPLYLDTLQRLTVMEVSALYFGHFGITRQVNEILHLAMEKLQNWGKIVDEAIKDSGFDHAAEKLTAQIYLELEPLRKMGALHQYLIKFMAPLIVAGYMKYCCYNRRIKVN